MSWKPDFSFATLYSVERKYDFSLFTLKCKCKYMPLKGSQFKKDDECLYYFENLCGNYWVNVKKVDDKKVNDEEVSTYSLSEFRKYFI